MSTKMYWTVIMSRKLSGLNPTSDLQTMSRNIISSLEQAASLKVSVSIKDVINHLDFLKSVEDQDGKFYDATYVKNSLRRYEKFWLPLMLTIAENPDNDTKYAPPLGMLLIPTIFIDTMLEGGTI